MLGCEKHERGLDLPEMKTCKRCAVAHPSTMMVERQQEKMCRCSFQNLLVVGPVVIVDVVVVVVVSLLLWQELPSCRTMHCHASVLSAQESAIRSFIDMFMFPQHQH